MEEIVSGIGAIWLLVILVFVLLLCFLWIVLPFAVFGIKDRLDKLLAATKQQNDLLSEIREILKRVS